jgi:hypothetical protein
MPPEPPAPSSEDDNYLPQDLLEPHEADQILSRLQSKNIRFQIETNTASPGRHVHSHRIQLYIHIDDFPAWLLIRDEFIPPD